jgi:hypothetical protein
MRTEEVAEGSRLLAATRYESLALHQSGEHAPGYGLRWPL